MNEGVNQGGENDEEGGVNKLCTCGGLSVNNE